MATIMAQSRICSRHQLISHLWSFRIFSSRNISCKREGRWCQNQNCVKFTARSCIHIFRRGPERLLSRFASGLATRPNVRPHVNVMNDSPCISVIGPGVGLHPGCFHRQYSNLGTMRAKANVHLPPNSTTFNIIHLLARCIQTRHVPASTRPSKPNFVPFKSFSCTCKATPKTHAGRIQMLDISYRNSEGTRSHARSTGSGFCIASSVALLFFNFKKEEEEEKDSIELLVAKAVSAEKRGQMGDAANFYHQAVTLAQQQNKKDKVAFIYDMMANFYLRIDENYKAEKLFKETIKLLLESGFEKHDPAILEISLKLAGIYELQFRYTEAEAGYRFCVSKSEEGVESYKKSGKKDSDSEMNLYAMLGASLDAFGKFMLKQHHLDEAERAYLRAIKICENELADKGKPHPQAATILNDLGTVYEQKKNYSKAMEVICKAEELAKDSKEDLAVIMCNKASLHLRNGNREDATSLFRQALRLAERSQDEETIRFVKIAMTKLAAPLRKDSP